VPEVLDRIPLIRNKGQCEAVVRGSTSVKSVLPRYTYNKFLQELRSKKILYVSSFLSKLQNSRMIGRQRPRLNLRG